MMVSQKMGKKWKLNCFSKKFVIFKTWIAVTWWKINGFEKNDSSFYSGDLSGAYVTKENH